MEMKSYQDTVHTMQCICDTKSELSIETEILLPDYLPQVFKIVKCFAHLVVLQKQFSAAKLTVEGYLRLSVWYQTQENETLCTTEQKMPFSKQFELQADAYAVADAVVSGEPQYINCRAINPRRIDIRGAYAISVQARAQMMQEVVTALSGAGVQQKMIALDGVQLLATQEKMITAQETVYFEQEPEAVIDCTCYGEVQEIRFVSGKAMLKGALHASILYRAQDGCALQEIEKTIQFNEIIDADYASESCKSFALVEPVGCLLSNGEESGYSVSMTALLKLNVYQDTSVLAVADAFSTSHETELHPVEITLEQAYEPLHKEIEVVTTGALPETNMRIVATKAFATHPEYVVEQNASFLRGRVFFHVLCLNDLNEMNCYDKVAEYQVPLYMDGNAEQSFVQVYATVTSASARRSADEVSAAAMVRIQGASTVRVPMQAIEAVTCLQERPPQDDDIALRIYYTTENENLFDIAKAYATSPERIAKINQIPLEQALAKTQLLIPMGC